MQKQHLDLLIIHDSQEESDRLISMLENAGRSVSCNRVESHDMLNKLIESKSWNLIIAAENAECLPPTEAIRSLSKAKQDIPLIIISDEDGSQPCVEGLKSGARDVVKLDEDQHLLLVIDRELSNLNDRHARTHAETKFNDLYKQNLDLLTNSRKPSAFIEDGMFLFANIAFSELVNYESVDDLDCLPLIDIIKEDQHEELKTFFKDFSENATDTETRFLDLTLLRENSDDINVPFTVRKTTFEEEPCIQLSCQPQSIQSNGQGSSEQINRIKNQDALTGIYSKYYLIEHLKNLITKAKNKEYDSSLILIKIENIEETVREKLGPAAIDRVISKIAEFIQSNLNSADSLCRFGETAIMIATSNTNLDILTTKANDLAVSLFNNILEVDETTLNFNYLVGATLINHSVEHSDTPINQTIEILDGAINEKDTQKAFLYKPEETTSNTTISSTIEQALKSGSFKLMYQPIISLHGSEKEHYEVLLRLINTEGVETLPNEFLQEAVKMGAAKKIDRWVIQEAVKGLAEHRENDHDTVLNIQLFADSVKDETLVDWIDSTIKNANLSSDTVIFQIEESIINDHLNAAKAFTKSLKDIGCGVSISHFGRVLNPFKSLKEVHSDYTKIHGSFTHEMKKGKEGEQVLKDLITELHELDKITIVPFVENASLLSKLWQTGVKYIQGYYLQAPASSMDYEFYNN